MICHASQSPANSEMRFDETAARDAVDFVENACSLDSIKICPWQKAMLSKIFGWKRPDGSRRYRIKNGRLVELGE